MKTLNLFSHVWRITILVLPALLISVTGCTKQGPDPTGLSDELNDTQLKSLVVHKGTVNLQGYMRWYVNAKMEHKLIVDPEQMFTLCEAELTFTDKQNFTLHTRETIPLSPPVLFREMTINGKMSPGGALKFTWPETWMELNWATMELEPAPYANLVAQVRAHTGYELSGPGVINGTLNYNGFFNGTKFFADCHANGFQMEPGNMGAPYDIVVDGPIIFSMITDLVVVE